MNREFWGKDRLAATADKGRGADGIGVLLRRKTRCGCDDGTIYLRPWLTHPPDPLGLRRCSHVRYPLRRLPPREVSPHWQTALHLPERYDRPTAGRARVCGDKALLRSFSTVEVSQSASADNHCIIVAVIMSTASHSVAAHITSTIARPPAVTHFAAPNTSALHASPNPSSRSPAVFASLLITFFRPFVSHALSCPLALPPRSLPHPSSHPPSIRPPATPTGRLLL
jgi:hypothetical protein